MAGYFDDTQGGAVDSFADTQQDTSLTPPNQNTGTAGDIATSVKRGIQQLPGVVTGLADLPFALAAGIRPVNAVTNWVGEKTGFRPSKWAEEAQQEYSPGYQQAQQEIKQAWESPDTSALDVAKSYAQNPAYVANIIAESLPSTLAGGLAGRAIMGAGAVAQAVPAIAGAEGAASRIVPKMVGYLERKLGEKTAAAVAGGAGEGLVQAGSSLSEAKGEDQRKNAIAAIGSGLIDAVIGAGAGAVAQKLGFETAETALAKGFNRTITSELDAAATKGQKFIAKGKRIAGGAVSEGLLQELPQGAQEQVWANYAEGKPLWEGVPRSAVESMLAGIAMGAGANVVAPSQSKADKARDDVQSATLSNITKLPVTVQGGTATVREGERAFTIPAADLAEHFVNGGTIESLPATVRFGERGQFPGVVAEPQMLSPEEAATEEFARGARTYTRNRNARFTSPRQTPENAAIDAAMQGYAPIPPEVVQSPIDRTEPFTPGGATSFMPQPAPTTAEPESTEPETITSNGAPFRSASAAKGAVARSKATAPYEIIPEGEGFVARRIDADLAQAVTKKDGSGYATARALEQVAASKKIDLTNYRVVETTKGFIAIPQVQETQNAQEAGGSAQASGTSQGITGGAAEQLRVRNANEPGVATQEEGQVAPLESAGQFANPKVFKKSEVPKFKTKAEIAAYKNELIAQGYDGVVISDTGQSFTLDTAPKSGETVQSVISGVRNFLGGGFNALVRNGKIEVVQSFQDIKDAGVPLNSMSGRVAGVYSPKTKKIWLVADNIAKGDAEYIFRHEGAHAILREVPAFKAQKDKIISDFLKLAATDKSVRDAIARVPKRTREAVKNEEALAYWLQDKNNYKHPLFKRIIAAVKKFLKQLGFRNSWVNSLTTVEIADIFTGGVKAWAEAGGNVTENINNVFGTNSASSSLFSAATQAISSAATSLNQVAAIFKRDLFKPGTTNVDIGGGKYDAGTEYLAGKGVTNLVYDPFNRSAEHNNAVIRQLAQQRADTATVNNVLNVIKEQNIRREVVRQAAKAIKTSGTAYFQIHEGDKTGNSRVTKIVNGTPASWQNHQKTEWYVDDVKQYFDIVKKSGNLITATGVKPNASFTAWENKDGEALFSAIDDSVASVSNSLKTMWNSAANPKRTISQQWIQNAPKWLAVTPLDTLVQTFGKKTQQIRDFATHVRAYIYAKDSIVETAAKLRDDAFNLAKKGVGIDALNIAANTASFNRITPWESIEKQGWVRQSLPKEEQMADAEKYWKTAGMDKATKKSFRAAYAEAVSAYNALGSQELKDAYRAVVEHMADIRARDRNNLLTLIERTSEEGSELRKSLMAQFEASFNDLHGAYWPLSRYGKFRLEYTDTEGFKYVEFYDTIASRQAQIDALKEVGVRSESIKTSAKDERQGYENALPKQLMTKLSNQVYTRFMEGVDQNDTEAVAAAEEKAQRAIEDMNQTFLRWQPESSALKNSMRRGNIKGYNEDALRSYLDYAQRHAKSIAWAEQGRRLDDDIASYQADIREKAKDATEQIDTTLEQSIVNDLRKRVTAMRSVHSGPITSAITKLSTAYYMTSPSIALVQMSQLGVLTLPKLAAMFGAAKASRAMGKGLAGAFSKDYTRTKLFEDAQVNKVFDDIEAVVSAENRKSEQAKNKELGDKLYTKEEINAKVSKLDAKQQQLLALRVAMARNLLDISAAHEVAALARGDNPNAVRSKIFQYAMMPMSLSELASRKATILAAFDLAKQGNKDFFESMKNVEEVVNQTLYSYAAEERGVALQSGAARMLLQFQHYRMMTGIRLALLFNNMIRGESKDVRQAALKEFAGIMGASSLLAGTLGVPMVGATMAILSAILGDEDEPLDLELEFRNWMEKNFGQNLAGAMMYGLPNLAGVNVSKRIGLGDIYGMQSEPPPNKHGKELAQWYAVNALGPGFSVAQSWLEGYDEISKGNWAKGIEVATPKPIRDAMKAYRVATEGLKTGAGKRLLADSEIGPDEVMLLALGFSTDEVSRAQTIQRDLNKMTTAISERRGRLISDAAKGITEGDTYDALEAIRTFNKRMPRFAINGGDIRSAVRKIVKGDKGTTGRRERAVADVYEIPVY